MNSHMMDDINNAKKQVLSYHEGRQWEQLERPPLGVPDREIELERFNMERLKKLYEAIVRYIMADKEVPEEWTNEFNEIVRNFNNRGK